jgi:hypothetical protein
MAQFTEHPKTQLALLVAIQTYCYENMDFMKVWTPGSLDVRDAQFCDGCLRACYYIGNQRMYTAALVLCDMPRNRA